MAQIYDFMEYKKERDLVELEAECAELKDSLFCAYMVKIFNNDDGVNANIDIELIPDDT